MLPAPLVVLLGVAALLVSVIVYARSDTGWRLWILAVRAIAIAILTVLLLNPADSDTSDRTDEQKRPLHVLVDTSSSMNRKDANGQSRWQAVSERLKQSDWAEHRGARFHRFDSDLKPADPDALLQGEPDGRETRLVDSMTRLMNRDDLGEGASVVLISDGRDTAPIDADASLDRLADLATAKGIAVHVMPVGSTEQPPDLALHAYATPERVFTQEPVTIRAHLEHSGFAGQPVRLTLGENGQPVESVVLKLGADRTSVAHTFEVVPQSPGPAPRQVHYTLTADALDGEATDANNRRDLFVRRIGRRLRVVMFEGQPYWETRFLSRALRSDPQIDLTVVQALRADRIQTTRYGVAGEEPPPNEPFDPAMLGGYDVVVLGKGCDLFFPADEARQLEHYVTRQGHGLLAARGQPFDTTKPEGQAAAKIIQPLEPAIWASGVIEELKVQVTEAGRQILGDVEVDELPGMIAATRTEGTKSASVVLLRQQPEETDTPGMAAAAYQRAGNGRVLQFMTDGLWRWAMQPASRSEAASAYRHFVINAVRWLAVGGDLIGETGLALQLDQHAAQTNRVVRFAVRSINQSARHIAAQGYTLRIIGPDGTPRPLTAAPDPGNPNRLVGNVSPAQAGVYTITLIDPNGQTIDKDMLACYDPASEQRQSGARPDWLAELAERTGGMTLAVDQPLPAWSTLTAGPIDRQQSAQVRHLPIWPQTWVFAVLIGAMGVEWFARRLKGMP